jgi:hypothetical protein
MSNEDVKDIEILAERIKLLLAGQPLAVQGGALDAITCLRERESIFLLKHLTPIRGLNGLLGTLINRGAGTCV